MRKLIVILVLFLAGCATPSTVATLCAVTGDSIAVGLGRQLPECTTTARVGALTATINPAAAETVVISAGSNDLVDSPALRRALHALRQATVAVTVVWIVPSNGARSAVEAVAAEWGDPVVYFAPGADGVHPWSYPELAVQVRTFW